MTTLAARIEQHCQAELHNGSNETHGGLRDGRRPALNERCRARARDEHFGGKPAGAPARTRQRRDLAAPLDPQAHADGRRRALLRGLCRDGGGRARGATAARAGARCTHRRAARVSAGRLCTARRAGAGRLAQRPPGSHLAAAGRRPTDRGHRRANRPRAALRPARRLELGRAQAVRV